MKSYALLLLASPASPFAPSPISPGHSAVSKSNPRTSALYYTRPPDRPSDASAPLAEDPSADLLALADTERWIASTADASDVRKEVRYVCEGASSSAASPLGVAHRVVSRLADARRAGEAFGEHRRRRLEEESRGGDWAAKLLELEERMANPPKKKWGVKEGEEGKSQRLAKEDQLSFRQTLVVVLPGCKEYQSNFTAFDNLMQTINSSRRDTRTLVTKSDDEAKEGDAIPKWTTSVVLAHLHPLWGMDDEPEPDENEDPKLTAYKKHRLDARRSPYPTIVIEVLTTPPNVMRSEEKQDPPKPASKKQAEKKEEKSVTLSDLQKLEAAFGLSSAATSDAADDNLQTSPLEQAAGWIDAHDPAYHGESRSLFEEHGTSLADEAYDSVLAALARAQAESSGSSLPDDQYMVMPNFLPASATSLEKFAAWVTKILDAMPADVALPRVETFHPESTNEEKRCPVPVVALRWQAVE